MAQDVKALIKDARLPEDTVPICLRADLVAEHERAERELAQAQHRPSDSLTGTGVRVIAERIAELEQEMAASTVEFVLRAMPRPVFRALVAEHPPRKTESGEVDEQDRFIGVNGETFFTALIRRAVVAPVLDEEDWALLLGERLTDRQFDLLSDAAWRLNRRDVDVPFSAAASRILNSVPE